MMQVQALIAYAGMALLAAILVGLAVTRRYRLWYAFALNLLSTFVAAFLMLSWPARFHSPEFWQGKEMLISVLRFAMAIELAFRTFQSFPGAMATARRVLLPVMALTLVAVLAVPAGDYNTFVGQFLPRVLNGTVWLFTAIAALILWYRLPIHPFHKVVLIAYIPYLLIFTVAANALGAPLGWQRSAYMRYADQLAYVLLLLCWNYAVWRTQPAPSRAPVQLAAGAN